MATLITGGCGFVGLAIAERLLKEGRRVVLFDRRPAPAIAETLASQCETVMGDICDVERTNAAMSMLDVDTIIHTAAITPDTAMEMSDAARVFDVNLMATVRVIENCAKSKRVKRVVLLSSVAVYGFSEPASSGRYDEEHSPPCPAGLYGVSKLAAEQAALRIGHLHGMDVRVVRLGPVFGPWEHQTGVRAVLSPHFQAVSAASRGAEIILPRPMDADWLYSRDAARAIELLAHAPKLQFPIYNVGGKAMTSLSQWCELLSDVYPKISWRVSPDGRGANVQYGLLKDRPALDIGRLEAEVGYAGEFSLRAACSDYMRWAAGNVQLTSGA